MFFRSEYKSRLFNVFSFHLSPLYIYTYIYKCTLSNAVRHSFERVPTNGILDFSSSSWGGGITMQNSHVNLSSSLKETICINFVRYKFTTWIPPSSPKRPCITGKTMSTAAARCFAKSDKDSKLWARLQNTMKLPLILISPFTTYSKSV